ncbi:hypothetical protein CVT24_010917 [Panaeolus cyanescens]|uniref:BTB domain-containing protein n=1 Tax=Panaeolus cyanescens TaxID=181874 RepID=A0A409YVQ2_9AGAR|nr:hypothetical protein CVT24_010917 [Panaeolus cyanescens]
MDLGDLTTSTLIERPQPQTDAIEDQKDRELISNSNDIVKEEVKLKYDDYYNEIVVFKVEDTIFRAFKKAFTIQGCFFESMFSLPRPSEAQARSQSLEVDSPEGTSDSNPIVLEGISKAAFRSFLKVLMPIEGVSSYATNKQWLSVLDLSTMWDFQTVRAKAIKALGGYVMGLQPPERIILSWKYEVKAWLINALVYAARQTTISRKALRQAGVDPDTISGIYSVREMARSEDESQQIVVQRGQCRAAHIYVTHIGTRTVHSLHDWNTYYQPTPEINADDRRLREIVMEEFADELKGMRND